MSPRRSQRIGKDPARLSILSVAALVNRFGKVDEGTTSSPTSTRKRSRAKHTLSASLAYAEWKSRSQPVDTPGHGQLLADARAALSVATPRWSSWNAVGGVMVQPKKSGRSEELALPRLVVLNRLDRERASLERCSRPSRSCNRHGDFRSSCRSAKIKALPRRRRVSWRKKRSRIRRKRERQVVEGPVRPTWRAVDTAREALIGGGQRTTKADGRSSRGGTLTRRRAPVAAARRDARRQKSSPWSARRPRWKSACAALLDAINGAYLPSPADRPFKASTKRAPT